MLFVGGKFDREPAPCILKELVSAIAPTSRRSLHQAGDRTNQQAIAPSNRRSLHQAGDRSIKQAKI
ncbi:MAG TPA: hypothetical protein VK211_27495 [Kamptonema sp.]|nr:hypothetical protein [Kamptonema sp.]